MIQIDNDKVLVTGPDGQRAEHAIGTPEAFAILSKLWLRSGFDVKYVYSFTWLGRPILQLPEDMFRLQEVIYTLRPDVIVECGIAHGGGLIFYASLCKAIGQGRVIGVDVEIRPHNRAAIAAHELSPLITLLEGSSIAPEIVRKIYGLVKPGEKVLVCLDSNHSRDHVLAELEAYAGLITPGSYIVAMDGVKEDMVGAKRFEPDWLWDNPRRAALQFVERHPEFNIEEPAFAFNEGTVSERITYWPSAFLKKVA